MDILLGDFVDANIEEFSQEELIELEKLMEIDDNTLYKWLSGISIVESQYNTMLFRKFCEFNESKHRS